MQLTSWNYRGLGNPTKAEAIKDLLKMEPTDILMLQETKVEGEILLSTSNTKWKFDSGKVVSARGTAGGIGTFWAKNSFSLERSFETQHWIFTELRHTASNLNLALFNMYVPVHYEEKRECWKTLSDFLYYNNPRNIIIGGDLNIILDPKEKRGGTYSRDPFLTIVENIILQRDLVDFKPVKGKYIWTNNRTGENHIAARLDRFLISNSIMMGKRIVINKILPKLSSDHKPVLLCLKDEEDLGPLPFRFSPLWVEREGFFEIVQTTWSTEVSEIILSNGQVCKGFTQIKEAAVKHFQTLLTTEKEGSEEDLQEFLANIPKLISTEDNENLMSSVTEEEVSNIVWSMEPDKARGPDGFSIHFYRICWVLIKPDLLRMIRGFMRKAKIGGRINSTFLALIPKETNPGSLDRYRPISLCNASYKIVAKLLASRIKPLLKKLISLTQGGFVKGRHILDNVIQVQEALHSSHSRKEQSMLIKLDMCNAFDRVNYSFLYRVLSAFGFNQEFINIIKACLEKIWIAPMVNDRPEDFFLATWGLRQGCPLSPFLYILMADSLIRELTLEKQKGNLPGIRIVK
eukprot:PITA_28676